MKITDQLLQQHGFEYLMSDYWRKGKFSLLRTYRDNKEIYIVGGVNIYPYLENFEELKEIYKKETGEELKIE